MTATMNGHAACAQVRRQLGFETVIRIANAISAHPRFERLFDGLDGLYAWTDRADAHYLAEVERIGPTKAGQQIRRIVNEVALVGDA